MCYSIPINSVGPLSCQEFRWSNYGLFDSEIFSLDGQRGRGLPITFPVDVPWEKIPPLRYRELLQMLEMITSKCSLNMKEADALEIQELQHGFKIGLTSKAMTIIYKLW